MRVSAERSPGNPSGYRVWPPSVAGIGPGGIVCPDKTSQRREQPSESAPCGARSARTLSFIATLFVALAVLEPAGASLITPEAESPARCALELEALDETGIIRLQTTAVALDRPGELLVSLSRLRAGRSAFSRLTVAHDPDLTGRRGEGPRFEVTELIGIDPAGDLAWLLAPDLASCGASESTGAIETFEGARFIGLRDRDGYRSRIFDASLERTIDFPGGGELMLLRLEDGAGAGGGFLFDRRGRLAGSILEKGSDADPSLACARRISIHSGSGRDGDRRPSPVAIPLDRIEETPIALFARALLLTRPDQTDDAIALINESAARVGEFTDLLLERGVRRYRIGRTAPAIEDFARAARLAPDHYLAHYNLGMALGAFGRFAEAARQFERAHAIAPQQPRALYQLALAHEAARRPDLALLDYEQLIDRDSELASELHGLLGY